MKTLVALFLALLVLGCVTQEPASNTSASASPNASAGGGFVAVKNNDVVKVDYVGSTGGKVFDTSLKEEAEKAGLPLRPVYEPLQFTVGAGQMIKGFDEAVVRMKVGEEKTVVLKPEEAYGPVDKNLIQKIPRDKFANGAEAKAGMRVTSPTGAQGTVTAVDNDSVTVDFNHFLAGKTLTFKIILRSIN